MKKFIYLILLLFSTVTIAQDVAISNTSIKSDITVLANQSDLDSVLLSQNIPLQEHPHYKFVDITNYDFIHNTILAKDYMQKTDSVVYASNPYAHSDNNKYHRYIFREAENKYTKLIYVDKRPGVYNKYLRKKNGIW